MAEFLSANLGNNKSFVQRFQREIETVARLVTTESAPAKLQALRRVGASAIIDKSFRTDDVSAVLDPLFPSA